METMSLQTVDGQMQRHKTETQERTFLAPRYYQQMANDAVWSYLQSTSGNCAVVLPTGAGKSLLYALIIQQALEFGAKVIVLADVKELIEQNAEELRGLIPGVDVGLYSAGLNKRQTGNDVVFAGIQSVYKRAAEFGPRKLIIVDEVHMINDQDETMYRTFLEDMKRLNDGLRIVGATATPFRTGTGPICGPDRLFNRIVYEAKTGELIQEGFLCPIITKPATSEVETGKVPLRGDEFLEEEAQKAFMAGDNVSAACMEILEKCHDRHSILIFASGIAHAESVAQTLETMTGERVGVVTGETLPIERAQILSDFRSMKLRFVVNVGVMTKGTNVKCIDAVAILRMSMSPGLIAQMAGRGLRTHESKKDCLILDFGQNFKRFGSIDDPNFGYSEAQSGGKRAAVAAQNGRGKECPACGLDVSANSRTCPECGFLFPVNHNATADEESQLTGEMPPETWIVVDVHCKRHTKKDDPDAPPTVRVDYVVNKPDTEGNLATRIISEWTCPQHEGFARLKFQAWWDARSLCMYPDTVDDALELIAMGVCRHPSSITTKKDGKYTRIVSCEFVDEKPTTLKEVKEAITYTGVDDDVPF